MGGGRSGAYRTLLRNLRVRDHWEDVGVERRIILKGTFKKQNEEVVLN